MAVGVMTAEMLITFLPYRPSYVGCDDEQKKK